MSIILPDPPFISPHLILSMSIILPDPPFISPHRQAWYRSHQSPPCSTTEPWPGPTQEQLCPWANLFQSVVMTGRGARVKGPVGERETATRMWYFTSVVQPEE